MNGKVEEAFLLVDKNNSWVSAEAGPSRSYSGLEEDPLGDPSGVNSWNRYTLSRQQSR